MDPLLRLDPRALERARVSRDARFDGKFFVAVTSTRIYCRPICPAPTSKAGNVRYYATAAAAAAAGFRPCLRCRPEAAPGTPAWLGTSAVVRRALRMIHDGVLDEISVAELAARLGLGARHLDRLFLRHVGVGPVALAQTRRLHFAKRLLDDTDLPITEVALASGFGSVRRFNFAFQRTYRRSPRELRRLRRGGMPDGEQVRLRLAFRPPYDWAHMCRFLAARAVPGVESIDEQGYARAVRTEAGYAVVRVRAPDGEDALELRVQGAAPSGLFQISSAARRVFDLAADPAGIALAFKSDALLGPLVRAQPGLRIPGAWDPFECAVRAVLGQQVSVAAARTLAARLVARAGMRIDTAPSALTHLFPDPEALLGADLDGLGITGARIAALRALASAMVEGTLDFSAGAEEVVEKLASLPGFGVWTAQYVVLRALGEPDAFPSGDLVLRRMAGGGASLTARELDARAEAWRPWRGYAVMHLWNAAAGRPVPEQPARISVRRLSPSRAPTRRTPRAAP